MATKDELSAGVEDAKDYADEGIQEIADGLNDLTNYVETGFSNIEYAIDEKLDTTAFESVSGDFLTSVPLFDTSSVESMNNMFYVCSSLTSVPRFDISSVTSMNYMLYKCNVVEGGALALYQQASAKNPQPDHYKTFIDCGKDTATGTAELTQIPASWGGNA